MACFSCLPVIRRLRGNLPAVRPTLPRASSSKEVTPSASSDSTTGSVGKIANGVPLGVLLADAAYGTSFEFREQLAALGLDYIVGIASTTNLFRISDDGQLAADVVSRAVCVLRRRRADMKASPRHLPSTQLVTLSPSCPRHAPQL